MRTEPVRQAKPSRSRHAKSVSVTPVTVLKINFMVTLTEFKFHLIKAREACSRAGNKCLGISSRGALGDKLSLRHCAPPKLRGTLTRWNTDLTGSVAYPTLKNSADELRTAPPPYPSTPHPAASRPTPPLHATPPPTPYGPPPPTPHRHIPPSFLRTLEPWERACSEAWRQSSLEGDRS